MSLATNYPVEGQTYKGIRFMQQRKPGTCIATCVTMLMRAVHGGNHPGVFVAPSMSSAPAILLNHSIPAVMCYPPDALTLRGWHMAQVPCLNCPPTGHCILVYFDPETQERVVLDPAIGEHRYRLDGSDLMTWGNLVFVQL